MAATDIQGSSDIYFWNLRIDPRVKDYVFVGNPLFPIIVCGGYLLLVYRILPEYMKNRPAYDLKNIIHVQNLFMIFANAFFFYKFITNSYLANYNLFCQGMTYSTDENSMNLVHYLYCYLLLRTLDFLDTFFFILRKKDSHVTFQHVSHHFFCIFTGHIWITLGSDGQTLFGVTLNALIHVFMYTYYFLSAFGERFKPYLWWKKYLTSAQIYQHVAIIIHGIVPVVYDCGYPRFFVYLAMPQGLLGLILFLNFYASAYSKKNNLSPDKMSIKAEEKQRLQEAKKIE